MSAKRSPKKNAWQKTLAILNRSMQSEAWLTYKLKKQGFDDGEIQNAAQKAKDYKLLDDRNYADLLVKSEQRKGRSPQWMRAALLNHGINKELAAQVLTESNCMGAEAQLAQAQLSIKKKFSRNAKMTQDQALRYLLRQGFDWEIARKTVGGNHV